MSQDGSAATILSFEIKLADGPTDHLATWLASYCILYFYYYDNMDA